MEHLRLFPPRPRVSPITATQCWCLCHKDEANDGTVINGLAGPGVPRVDVVGAATACDRCRDGHCPALSGRPPELAPKPRWNPAPLVACEPQADGGACGPA